MGNVPFILNGVKDRVGIFAPRLNNKITLDQKKFFF